MLSIVSKLVSLFKKYARNTFTRLSVVSAAILSDHSSVIALSTPCSITVNQSRVINRLSGIRAFKNQISSFGSIIQSSDCLNIYICGRLLCGSVNISFILSKLPKKDIIYNIYKVDDSRIYETINAACKTTIPSLFITTSHTMTSKLCSFLKHSQKLDNIFITLHDYDNHHCLSNSLTISSIVDRYLTAHPHHNSLLVDYSCLSSVPIRAAPVSQFSRDAISQLLTLTSLPHRSVGPYGPHVHYDQFPLRNYRVTQAAQHSPQIYTRYILSDNN